MTAAEGTWTTEQWTYGGLAPGASGAKVAIWYDARRERQAFQPGKGAGHLYPGGVYEVEALRDPAGEVLSKRGAAYTGPQPDRAWAAELEAAAEVARIQLAAAAQERSDKRAGAFEEAIGPLEAIASKMVDPADVDALAMLVTRRLHNARYRAASRRRQS